ncbi:hypothetical protein TRAPUB_14243 [Trametes pubescens]|uniref:Uncharacterized protein n=1 Tax=Trametes pubescens TaxID=154538 RepID=A0A1M2VNX4_TRAPU|nr:hypothetical protein TRAPUB_14243 [Trametes pubescens]
MPNVLDITGFIISIISLLAMGVHRLKEIIDKRLPPGRLQAIKAELLEIRENLKHLERVERPAEAGALQRFQSDLEELDERAANLRLEVSKWTAKGRMSRHLYQTQRVVLSRDCAALHRDAVNLRVHLHDLPPSHPADLADDVQSTRSTASSSTAVSSPTATSAPSTATSSSTSASSSPNKTLSSGPSAGPIPAGPTAKPAVEHSYVRAREHLPVKEHDIARDLSLRAQGVRHEQTPMGRTSALETLPTDGSLNRRLVHAAKGDQTGTVPSVSVTSSNPPGGSHTPESHPTSRMSGVQTTSFAISRPTFSFSSHMATIAHFSKAAETFIKSTPSPKIPLFVPAGPDSSDAHAQERAQAMKIQHDWNVALRQWRVPRKRTSALTAKESLVETATSPPAQSHPPGVSSAATSSTAASSLLQTPPSSPSGPVHPANAQYAVRPGTYRLPTDYVTQQRARLEKDYLILEAFVLDWIWPHRDRGGRPTCVLDILRTYATLRSRRIQKQRWDMHIPDITSGQIADMLRVRLHNALMHRGQDVEIDALLSRCPELHQVILLYGQWLKSVV